ncbi:hypothetical protein TGS27_1234 [Geobacillus stearothermophilus]|uniref:Uncharacterized protein n=1 Tax=Geobacillus stearothermophilus TaxID=1422 RepID=A0ABQ7HGK9_GEOSE|nr:hypothetical protein GS8_1493 [Geobacillus stearothermophilus]OAO83099.1 hypothetical protein TGS27_1234 [Geobacillus stearothermophilus]
MVFKVKKNKNYISVFLLLSMNIFLQYPSFYVPCGTFL